MDEREERIKEYQDYLSRAVRNSSVSAWQVHQRALSRAVAEGYGLTPEEILWLDGNL